MKPNPNEPTRWLDRPENVTTVYRAVWVACGLLLAVEPLIDKHGDLEIEHWFGFHGLYGFVGCVILVLAAKWMRTFLKRDEDFYER